MKFSIILMVALTLVGMIPILQLNDALAKLDRTHAELTESLNVQRPETVLVGEVSTEFAKQTLAPHQGPR